MVVMPIAVKGEDEPDVTFSRPKHSADSKKEEISLIQYENPSDDPGKVDEPIVERKLKDPLLKHRESDDEDDSKERKPAYTRRVHKDSRRPEDEEEAEVAEEENAESVAIPIEDDAEVIDEKAQQRSNSYAAKKTVAQGMMDIALITANANQLRFMLEYNRRSATFLINLVLIIISLLLQVAVGVALIFKGRLDMRGQSKHTNAKRINNYVVVSVFLVTIINVFIASFTVTGTPPVDPKSQ